MPGQWEVSPPRGIADLAKTVAKTQLGSMPIRWRHTQAVARQARKAGVTVHSGDRPLLEAAAWLHDIGYAARIADTGFHPLDGARYLKLHAAPQRLINLVANHSCSRFEADERSMLAELESYPLEVSPVADALIWADMTTGPTGQAVTVEERLAEILLRYAAKSPVHRATKEATADIVAAASRVEQRLAEML